MTTSSEDLVRRLDESPCANGKCGCCPVDEAKSRIQELEREKAEEIERRDCLAEEITALRNDLEKEATEADTLARAINHIRYGFLLTSGIAGQKQLVEDLIVDSPYADALTIAERRVNGE